MPKYTQPMNEMVKFVRAKLDDKMMDPHAAVDKLRTQFKQRFPGCEDHQFNSAMILAAGDLQIETAKANARIGAEIAAAQQLLGEFAKHPEARTIGDLIAIDRAARQ